MPIDGGKEVAAKKPTARLGQYFPLLGVPLRPQGVSPHYSRFGGLDCFSPR